MSKVEGLNKSKQDIIVSSSIIILTMCHYESYLGTFGCFPELKKILCCLESNK